MEDTNEKVRKPKEAGVIYLSYIPPFMNVKKVRELISNFGKVERIFLQPGKSSKPGKPSKYFTEGWVEFADKKVAKRTARILNGAQVGGKRHAPFYDSLWSMKYLSKFRWTHLTEKLALERAKKKQAMRTEISKAKQEVDICRKMMERQQWIRKHGNKKSTSVENSNTEIDSLDVELPQTIDSIQDS